MKLFDLTGKVAILTGSSKGIGKAAAEALAEACAKVVISSRTQGDCDEVAKAINTRCAAGRALAIAADIGSREDLRALVDRTRAAFGRIDILVCNAASSFHFGPAMELDEESFRKTLENNVLSNHFLIKLVVPEMMERHEGAITIVSSIGGMVGALPICAYNVSKAGDFQLARNLAVELGRFNIRVNAVAPGLIRTEFSRIIHENPETEADFNRRTPLGRLGLAEDVAGAVLFLSSPASAYMTGQSIVVDGGILAKGG